MVDIEARPAEPVELIRDSVDAPAIFVDGIHGMQVRNGVASINFVQHIFPAPNSDLGDAFNQVVLRMVVPASVFGQFADWFSEARDGLVEKGAIVTEAPKDGG